jgi:hypothetical protein
MAKEVVAILAETIAAYVDIYPARAAAVRVAAAHKDAVADAGGIRNNGKLIVATPDPDVILRLAVLRRALDWVPSGKRISDLANSMLEPDGVYDALEPQTDMAVVRTRLLAYMQ